ncbi:hypothetical protein BTHE68_71790 (plasmid) [Burkholderia sp. THE68]|uniref:hypothetical protein n=1 Tax=Burkholderia sp. THE68 TaxID=758782 RepID=UPI0013161F7F|nr:hypothetical protein [Burkholderia sp. THE68]BBU33445.1 hypothetical protein BTHE68_71790 [Burkholderia sp. THE68]
MVRKGAALALTLAAMVGSAQAAEDWFKLGTIGKDTIYMDRASARRLPDGGVVFWLKTIHDHSNEHPDPHSLGYINPELTHIRSACDAPAVYVTDGYVSYKSDGGIFEANSYEHRHVLIPGSTMQAIVNNVCGAGKAR